MNASIRFPFLIFTLIQLLVSCKSNIENLKPVQITSESVLITGNILNPTSGNNSVNVEVMDILSGRHLTSVSLIDSSGNFQLKFDLYYPLDVLLKYGDDLLPLILHPKDSIHIVLDANDISDKAKFATTVQFFGDAADVNANFIHFQTLLSKTLIPQNQYIQLEKDCKPDEFVLKLDSLRSVQEDVASEFIKLQNITGELVKWIENKIKLDYYNRLISYVYNHAQNNNLDYRTVVPSSFYDVINVEFPQEMIYNSNSAHFIGGYRISRIGAFSKKFSTKSLIGYLWDRNGNTYFGSSTEQEIEVIKKITKDELLTELLIAKCLFGCLERRELDEFEKHYSVFTKLVHEPYLREPIINHYCTIKKHLLNPEIAKNSLLISAEDTPVNELIKKITQEHSGKIIYLDIWATWCSPCIGEMPYSKKLISELDSDKVDFVYLCIDSKEDRWKALISEMEIEGNHYLATPDQSRFIYKLFEMGSVPHYALIGTDGNIIEKGNHLRPSLSTTKTKILNLIND
jgi:hypothetical protein